jgi:teichuronic acid biosynthesis glycosyltransferase TuaC
VVRPMPGIAERVPAAEVSGPALAAQTGTRRLRVLTLTSLYPSTANARHGIFVETRLRKLKDIAPVDVEVIAPVPWFPFTDPRFGDYARYAATPPIERRHDITVRHPRYVVIPKIGMSLQPAAMAAATLRAVREVIDRGFDFDVIDAHYFYPDGVAAARLARQFDKPFVITARGSDVNLIARMPGPRAKILAAAAEAGRVIAVSAALKRALVALGVRAEHVEVLRNGVDMALFRPVDRESMRAELGAGAAPLIASVGNLVAEKGHDLVLRAAARMPHARVVIVGTGRQAAALRSEAKRLGMTDRVRFVDPMAQEKLAALYTAADVLALGSTREGWPNVLLEAMACGTPVVATDVGGVREIVAADVAGQVVESREPEAFAAALRTVLLAPPERAKVRAYSASFDWQSIARRQFEILSEVAGAHVATTHD